MCQFPVDSHWAMESHMPARARLRPPPEVEPPEVEPPEVEPPVERLLEVATGRLLVPTSSTRLTGALVTFEEIGFEATTLPSTVVVRTVTTRDPGAPARDTRVWSL